MKKILLLASFFLIAPVNLIASISLLSYTIHAKTGPQALYSQKGPLYAALPPQENTISDFVVAGDGKTETVRQFLAKYGSPLTPFAQNIVSAAEKYNIDFKLLPAIAMQESNLCKKAPAGSFNCWGFGIYGGKILTFEGYEEAIEAVTKGLAVNYVDRGLVTPEEIMQKYTPSNNGDWADSVTHFMEELR